MGFDSHHEREAEKRDEDLFPETDHHDVAEEGEVVKLVIAGESHGAAQRVWFKAHIGIGEEQPIARGGLVGFLKGVGFAEPAFGKFIDVDDTKAVVSGGEVIENLRGGIAGAIVHSNDFKAGIIDLDEGGQCGRKLFLLIASGENQRNPRAIGVFCGRIAFELGHANGAIGYAQAVGEPQESDESEKDEPEKVHADWSRKPASGYASTDAKKHFHCRSGTCGPRAGAAVAGVGLEDWSGCGADEYRR